MGRYNGHFSSKFEGCMIVGLLHDESRKRIITCYAIAGEPEVVGFFDGVDTWVGSASMCNKTVQQELAAVHRGEPREIEFGQTRRRMLDAPGVNGNPQYPLYSASGGTPRRRAVAASDAPTAPNPPRVERKRATVAPEAVRTVFAQPVTVLKGEVLSVNVVTGEARAVKERRRAQ